ncbi:MT-A70-domain-containing protein [Xylaria palmicola]|nr:MT-A70-domain-containing protein [Xylaria palmicola]
MEPSVLFESSDGAAVVIDVPRSLEEAQVLPGRAIPRRIISTAPAELPWKVPEPKRGSVKHVSPSAAVAELMALESVKAALALVRAGYDGPWCLPRVTCEQAIGPEPTRTGESGADAGATKARSQMRKRRYRPSSASPLSEEDKETSRGPLIPEQSCHLLGTIASEREAFLRDAPQFDLVVLDPPWPSRSVKRKSDSYTVAHDMGEVRALLSQIPIASHLKHNGLVAIWVTNKAAVTDLLTEPGGMLAQWGLEPVGEWIWVKITSAGEPILDVESSWRKPWERLLIARKLGSPILLPTNMKVILGAPDIHSRKPNLRRLFTDILPTNYAGLEVFARNLTAGWWSWGNEVLLFQQEHHWAPLEDGQVIAL